MRPLSFLRVVILLLALASLAAPAQADSSKSLVWKRFDVALDVQKNGLMQVAETQQIQFQSGYWQNGGRTIPLGRVDDISNVHVLAVQPGGGTREVPIETSVENNQLEILWHFPEASPGETRTFVVKYTVHGVVRVYPKVDQIRWQAVPPDRRFPVEESTVTLRLPGSVKPSDLVLASYPARLGGKESPTSNGAVFSVGSIPANQGWEVRAQFPKGIVNATKPSWQAQADREDYLNETVRPRNNFILLVIGFLIPVVGLVGLFTLWLTRGKDPSVGRDPESVSSPPSDLPAPLVGVLLDERVDVQDVISSIVSLAERGIIRITQVQNDKLLGSNNDYKLELVKDADRSRLRPYERTLIENLFGGGDSVMLSDAKGHFLAAIPLFRDQLYEEVVREGLFRDNPEKVRQRYHKIGVGIVVLAGVLGVLGLVLFSQYANFFFVLFPALGLAAVGFALMRLSGAMPVRTLDGAVAASQWRAFRSYLENIEHSDKLSQDKGAFERYMSYATAFHVGRSWIEKFSSVGVPAPPWYKPGEPVEVGGQPGRYYRSYDPYGGPVIIVPPFGGYYGGGGTSAGSGAGGAQNAPPSGNAGAGGGLFGGTGLFDFGNDTNAFDQGSNSLADLFDQASDAFGGSHWGGDGGGFFGGGGGFGGGAGGFGGGSGGGGADFS